MPCERRVGHVGLVGKGPLTRGFPVGVVGGSWGPLEILRTPSGLPAQFHVAAGVAILLTASSVSGRVFGCWMTGAGLNYAPLAVHAITLNRAGELDRELSGIDPGPELRRYGPLQLWIFIPLSLVVWDLAQRVEAAREP